MLTGKATGPCGASVPLVRSFEIILVENCLPLGGELFEKFFDWNRRGGKIATLFWSGWRKRAAPVMVKHWRMLRNYSNEAAAPPKDSSIPYNGGGARCPEPAIMEAIDKQGMNR